MTEIDIIIERVISGLANARRKGKRLGRPPVADQIYEKAKELRIDEGTARKRLKMDLKARI